MGFFWGTAFPLSAPSCVPRRRFLLIDTERVPLSFAITPPPPHRVPMLQATSAPPSMLLGARIPSGLSRPPSPCPGPNLDGPRLSCGSLRTSFPVPQSADLRQSLVVGEGWFPLVEGADHPRMSEHHTTPGTPISATLGWRWSS